MVKAKWDKLILNFLRNNKRHFTFEELYIGMRCEFPGISKEIVKDSIKRFCKDGKIIKLKFKGYFYLEYDNKLHFHEYCPICRRVVNCEYNYEVLDVLRQEIKNEVVPRNLEGSDLFFVGICTECKK